VFIGVQLKEQGLCLIMVGKLALLGLKNESFQPGVVVYNCNPSTEEAEIGRLQAQGQPGLHSEMKFLSVAFCTLALASGMPPLVPVL
jgi:hypothetical protein